MQHYRNPIIPGFYPDPSVCRVGEDFYLVTSSAEYFPGIPVFHSRDLIHWEQIGHCLTRRSQIPLERTEPSGGVWAPTIRHHQGIFYVASTNMNGKGNFFVTATDPAGEWSDPVWVEMGGIDPSLTFAQGHVYFTTNLGAPDGSPGFSQAELDLKTGKLLGEIRFLWGGSGGKFPEAPHLYAIGGLYYLMAAEGGTQFTHMETIARSSSPWGPFEPCPCNPILTNIGTKDNEVHCTGHGDLVQDTQGNWWMVHLGIRLGRKYMSHIGRETFLSPVTWGEDGWPVVNGGNAVCLDSLGDCLPTFPVAKEPECTHFDQTKLDFCWNYLRNPDFSYYRLTEQKSCLSLYGNQYDLDDLESPTALLRRQRYFSCRIEAKLEFTPASSREEAGIVVMTTNLFHYKFCKRVEDGNAFLFVEKTADDFRQTAARIPIPDGAVILRVDADPLDYHFSYSIDGQAFLPAASASSRFLSCEVIGRCFTGVYTGMYATGRGKDSLSPAHFDYFMLSPRPE